MWPLYLHYRKFAFYCKKSEFLLLKKRIIIDTRRIIDIINIDIHVLYYKDLYDV